MTFNRKIWLSWKTKKPCPACIIGTLDFGNEYGHLMTETESSKEMNSGGTYDYRDFAISLHLKCNNCNEVVVVSGCMSKANFPYDEDNEPLIIPMFYYPAPKIIFIPESCPKIVQKILVESFSLFWLDLGSCANKIRIAIEVLLNEQGVAKTKDTKNGKLELTLHSRLKLFENTNPDTAHYLMAIKWIGNAGSHYFEINNENVLDAYELLEYSLEKLFNDREKKLNKISEEINKNRKPRKI